MPPLHGLRGERGHRNGRPTAVRWRTAERAEGRVPRAAVRDCPTDPVRVLVVQTLMAGPRGRLQQDVRPLIGRVSVRAARTGRGQPPHRLPGARTGRGERLHRLPGAGTGRGERLHRLPAGVWTGRGQPPHRLPAGGRTGRGQPLGRATVRGPTERRPWISAVRTGPVPTHRVFMMRALVLLVRIRGGPRVPAVIAQGRPDGHRPSPVRGPMTVVTVVRLIRQRTAIAERRPPAPSSKHGRSTRAGRPGASSCALLCQRTPTPATSTRR